MHTYGYAHIPSEKSSCCNWENEKWFLIRNVAREVMFSTDFLPEAQEH